MKYNKNKIITMLKDVNDCMNGEAVLSKYERFAKKLTKNNFQNNMKYII